MSKNAYSVLGVPADATLQDIKSAYRKKALKSHPDHGGDVADWKEIQEAFEVLSDPEQRAKLDRGEDPLSGSIVTSRAEHAILSRLDNAFQQNRTHPIRFVCDTLDEERDAAREELSRQSAELGRLKARLSKFLHENDRTKNLAAKALIGDYLESRIKEVKHRIAGIEEDILAFSRALEYLNDIEKGSSTTASRSSQYDGLWRQHAWPMGY